MQGPRVHDWPQRRVCGGPGSTLASVLSRCLSHAAARSQKMDTVIGAVPKATLVQTIEKYL